MFLKVKKRISELMDTIAEMLSVLCELNDPNSAVSDCLAAVEIIFSQLRQENTLPQKTIEQLQIVQESFYALLNDYVLVNEKSVKILNDQVVFLKAICNEEIKAKLKVVFFPYNVSMWDSLATVYEAATKDEGCVASVVPIPYYKMSEDKMISTYEGERFPQNVPIIHYSKYNLEEEQPDIIFVHNIYDNFNTLTRVHEQYYTSNLKKYTDMLVYVPYYVSSFVPPKEDDPFITCNGASIKNVDKIIMVGDFLKKAAIRNGIPEEKILVLGSPKLDAIVNVMKEEIPYPLGWREKLEGRTVYLLNTGCMFFASDTFFKVGILSNFFNITSIDKNNILIWRPHPLTKTSILKYTPNLIDYYTKLTSIYIKSEIGIYNNIILDETDDYLPALKSADVLISADSSLLDSYLITEKKILFLGQEMPSDSLIPSNAFYYFYNKDEPWYELVKKFSNGDDPLAKNRKGIASKVYTNTDGTCGDKVYQAIKECVLKKSENSNV